MRLKDVVDLINAKTDCVDRPYVALENIVSWDAKFVASDAATEGTNACFKAGDVLFGKLRPYLAKGYLPDYDGICSTEFLVMRPHDDMNGRYLLYWLLSPEFISVIKNRVAGVKMPRTDWATVSQMELTPPTLTAQRHIVAYLDEKTAAIDSRVAVLEQKLAAYKRLKASVINRAVTRGLDPKAKLKDSGVDWIGPVPEGWKVRRVKDCFKVISGSGFKPELQGSTDGDYPVCKASDIAQVNGNLSGAANWLTREQAMNAGFNVVPAGSVIFAKIGEAMKKNNRAYCLVDCCVDNNCQGLSPIRFDARYGYYLLRLIDMCWFDSLGPIPCVDNKALRGFQIPTPPLAEQRAIADYLDAEFAKIDKMAELVTREIELYKKLKRSLINEVVTGKREVA